MEKRQRIGQAPIVAVACALTESTADASRGGQSSGRIAGEGGVWAKSAVARRTCGGGAVGVHNGDPRSFAAVRYTDSRSAPPTFCVATTTHQPRPLRGYARQPRA